MTTLDLPNAHPWMSAASCADDPVWFHPDPSDRRAIAVAKAICQRCPVLASCAEWTFNGPRDDYAVLAGTTAEERARMKRAEAKRERKAAARGEVS